MSGAIYLKHPFVSVKSDGGDATQVQPSNWNDGHLFTGGVLGDLLVRDAAEYYGAKWVTPAAGGTWVDVPYSAANYFGSGGMTWTVTAGAQVNYSHMVVGRTVFVQVNLSGTSVSAAGQPFNIRLPAGFAPARGTDAVFFAVDSGFGVTGRCQIVSGDTVIHLYRSDFQNWALSASATNLSLQFFYQY